MGRLSTSVCFLEAEVLGAAVWGYGSQMPWLLLKSCLSLSLPAIRMGQAVQLPLALTPPTVSLLAPGEKPTLLGSGKETHLQSSCQDSHFYLIGKSPGSSAQWEPAGWRNR